MFAFLGNFLIVYVSLCPNHHHFRILTTIFIMIMADPFGFTHVLVRDLPESFFQALTMHPPPEPINVQLARYEWR